MLDRHNWYWLVDGLLEREYPVMLAHLTGMEQYNGLKEADDLTDPALQGHPLCPGILNVGLTSILRRSSSMEALWT